MADKEATARVKINRLLEAAAVDRRLTMSDIPKGNLGLIPLSSTRDFRAVPEKYRNLVPEYVKDYVSLNQFAP